MASKSAESVRRAIDRLDLKAVVAVTAKTRRWSAKRAATAELWYRRHLWLAYLNRGRALGSIAADSDHIWHSHILDTPKYARDCRRIFGHYIDHVPGRHPAGRALARGAYEKEFGRLPPRLTDDCWIPIYSASA